MATKLECERRFLLKRLPLGTIEATSKFSIHQFYVKADPNLPPVRYRHQKSINEGSIYFKTVKVMTPSGVYEEYEDIIEAEEFDTNLANASKVIWKMRYKVPYGDGEMFWEIDDFFGMKMIIAEIEMPDMGTEIILPDWLKSDLVMEVTGMIQFSNYYLADLI